MQLDPTPLPTAVARKPYGFKRISVSEFNRRAAISRQRPLMKDAVRKVLVDGVPVSDIARALGQTQQNIYHGVVRFMGATSVVSAQRMSADHFEFAARTRQAGPTVLEAARLYLVEGYSVSEACRATGERDTRVRDLAKRMAILVRNLNSDVPPPSRALVYKAPHESFVWPTAQELEALATSCLVRPLSAMTYTRAHDVMVRGKAPADVTKLTGSSLQFVLYSLDSVVAQLERYRFHMRFPKSKDYLATIAIAAAKRVRNDALRSAVQHYLCKKPDLDEAAKVGNVLPADVYAAVRSTVHEMERMKKFNLTNVMQDATK